MIVVFYIDTFLYFLYIKSSYFNNKYLGVTMNKLTINDISGLLASMESIGFTSDDVKKISSPKFLLNMLLVSRGLKQVSKEIVIPDEGFLFQPIVISLDSFQYIPGKEIGAEANSLAEVRDCLKKQYPLISLLGAKEGDSIFNRNPILMSLWEWEIKDEENIPISIRYLFANHLSDDFLGIIKKDDRYLLIDIPVGEILETDFLVCYQQS